MKLNLDFYDKDINYDKSIPLEYDLTEMRKNLLNWYPFKENSSVLEIGAGYGDLTEVFFDKCSKITAVEFSKENGEAISERYRHKENLEVIIGDLEKINLQEKYDYITLIGILEYSPVFFESDNPYLDFIQYAKSKLKDDGKIIIATDNALGIQYFAGGKSEHGEKIFDTIINNTKSSKLFTKIELENLLRKSGLNHYQFYYPLPNYKLPNVIFSDRYLPKSNNSKSVYNIWYEENSIIVFNELEAMKNIIENNLFDKFANSFLVEVGLQEFNNHIKFISYNQLRKYQYRLMLKMYDEVVRKECVNKESFIHIEKLRRNIENLKNMGFSILETYNDNIVESSIFKSKTFDEHLVDLLNEHKTEEFYKQINIWYEHIKQRQLTSDNIEETTNGGLTILKKCYIDLVFENTVIENNDYVFYDQEWVLDNVPVEFILYRAINNLYSYNRNISKIADRQEVLKNLNIFDYIDIFKEVEQDFQDKVIDKNMLRLFSRPYTYFKDIENLNTFLELKDENASLCTRIEIAEEKIKAKELIEQNMIKEKQNLENECNILRQAREELNLVTAQLNKELSEYRNSRLHKLVEKIIDKRKELKNGK